MRICIDLDGTICEIKSKDQTYEEVKPITGAIESLQKLREAGHYIIIYTARHMKTCDGDEGKIIARVGLVTLNWLYKYQIPFDEIHFGKPYADVYIDDLAVTFNHWEHVTNQIMNSEVH